jgi:hypothetical protein
MHTDTSDGVLDRSPTPTKPVYVWTGAATLIGAVSIPGSPSGINLTTTTALALAAIWTARRNSSARSDHLLIASILAILILLSTRSAPWLVALDVGSIVVIASIVSAGPQGWLQMSLSTPTTIAMLPRGIFLVLEPAVKKAAGGKTLTPILRTFAMIVVVLTVFGGLFVSADAAFASIAEEWIVPHLDLSLLPARVATAIGIAGLIGSHTLQSLRAPSSAVRPQAEHQITLGGAEWKTTLMLVDLLFAAFVAVQITVLFAGHQHVLRTAGLTYAEYARQGFFQLIIAAVLTLVVVAAGSRIHCVRDSDRVWQKALLGSLCVLTLVILASALKRMTLYQEAYGFTRLRLLANLIILVLGGTFLLLLVAGAMWKGAWLPRAVAVMCATALVLFNLYNPDARIAEKNLDRFLHSGEIDVYYLAGLSPDAVPKLTELPEPERSCVFERMEKGFTEPEPIWSWNFGRVRAREALWGIPLTCPR